MEFNEVIQWLVASKYVTFHKSKPIFTALAIKELTGISKGLSLDKTVIEPNLPAITDTAVLVVGKKYTDAQWGAFYQEFILKCQIPARCEGTYGSFYDLNKYSIDGMKAFKKAIVDGFELSILIVAVTLYYKNKTRLKKAIGNYMLSEEWKTDYQVLLAKAADGKIDEHIKQETKHGTVSHYTRG